MCPLKEEMESHWRPANVVVAVQPDPAKSAETALALRANGFADKDIAIFEGGEGAASLDVEGKRSSKGLLRPLHAFWSYVSIEGPELRDYEEASESGKDIIAVRTLNNEQVVVARRILARSGSIRLRHFSRWNVALLPDDSEAA